MPSLSLIEWVCLAPVIGGSLYAVLCLLAALRFRPRPVQPSADAFSKWPPVTVLKPVHGVEKHLRDNLRTACLQDYPDYQVVLSVQEPNDPAIPLLNELQEEFGTERVSVAIEDRRAGSNGKINNLLGGLLHARHEILVISDSDIRVKPDYLRTIVAPLANPEVACVCTLYKAVCAGSWFERMELLTLNADFLPSVVFAHVTGAARFCLGASTALRRSTLQEIGGLESLADYLVEDYEMGRRIRSAGKRIAVVPYCADTVVDLKTPGQWWSHQVYWDQNTRAAQPGGFFATVLVRSIPFALLFALVRLGDLIGLRVLLGALAVRLVTAAVMLRWGFQDREGFRALALLPFRDLAALISWFLAFTKRTTVWRGTEFLLTRDGRLAPSARVPKRRLIVTGDDFGLAVPVNEAIEKAHRCGILTTASLMIGGRAAADAVARAKRLPSLKVGLHVVLVEGRPVLPPRAVPDLVDLQGEFSSTLIRAGFSFFFRPGVRRQLEAEIDAQFRAFQATGLALDHVNAHNHMHLHPTIMALILKVGRAYGLEAMRVPCEPPLRSWRASRHALVRRHLAWLFLSPWVWLLRRRLRRANVRSNDFVFGIHDSGHMRSDLVIRLLERLPPGVTEIYFHPATRRCPEIDRFMADYHHRDELEALISPAVRDTLLASGAQTLTFSEL